MDLEKAIEGEKRPTEEGEVGKIHSLYIRPRSWSRFALIKQWTGLSYSELVDLACGLIIAENLLPDEAVEELRKAGLFEGQDAVALELAGLHGTGIAGKWAAASGTLEKIKGLLEEIDAELENVGQAIEDHAEAVVLGPEETEKEEA